MARRRREDWSKLVQSWERSGQTCAEFCAAHGVNWHTLSWWKWRLGRESRSTCGARESRGAALSFVDYGTVGDAAGGKVTGAGIGVEVGSYTVRVPADFDAACLTRLLGVLETRGAG